MKENKTHVQTVYISVKLVKEGGEKLYIRHICLKTEKIHSVEWLDTKKTALLVDYYEIL